MKPLLFLFALCGVTCGGSASSSPAPESSPEDNAISPAHPSPPKAPTAGTTELDIDEDGLICEGTFPVGLFLDNLRTTDFSGLVRVTTASVTGPDGQGAPATHGYVNHRYEVTVLHLLKGSASPPLVILEMAEAGIAPKPPETVLLVSLCTAGSHAYAPDTAYVFTASECVQQFAKGLTIDPAHTEPGDACRTP